MTDILVEAGFALYDFGERVGAGRSRLEEHDR